MVNTVNPLVCTASAIPPLTGRYAIEPSCVPAVVALLECHEELLGLEPQKDWNRNALHLVREQVDSMLHEDFPTIGGFTVEGVQALHNACTYVVNDDLARSARDSSSRHIAFNTLSYLLKLYALEYDDLRREGYETRFSYFDALTCALSDPGSECDEGLAIYYSSETDEYHFTSATTLDDKYLVSWTSKPGNFAVAHYLPDPAQAGNLRLAWRAELLPNDAHASRTDFQGMLDILESRGLPVDEFDFSLLPAELAALVPPHWSAVREVSHVAA